MNDRNDRQETDPRKPARRMRRIGLALFLIALLLLGAAVGRLAWAGLALKADVDAAQALLASDLQTVDVQEAARLLSTTRADLDALRRAARPFLWLTKYLGWVPRYGADLQAAPVLLDMAVDMTTAADLVLGPLAPLAAEALSEEGADRSALLADGLQTLHDARPQLTQALAHVRSAERARRELTPGALDPRVQAQMPRLDQALELLGLGTRASLMLPELLGADEPRTLLVLIENEDELRATGGFISGVARITLDGAAVEELVFEDSYAIDDFSFPYPDPPQPLLEYMLSELWLLRDSNWSPDWPTSAQAAIDLYTISREAEIDGVLAIDQRAIRGLIDALGPLYVEGHPEPITGENVIAIARQTWEQGLEEGGDWWWHRKDFMVDVMQAAVERLSGGLDQAALYRLYKAATTALDEKHVLVYLREPGAAALVSELGWDGAVRDDPGDYFLVVDTNLGFNKANALVRTELEYAVDLSDPALPQARLTVRHHHPLDAREAACRHEPRYDETYAQMTERCYWDYLRVYVPAASTLTEATPHAIPADALLSGRPSPAEVTVGPPEQGRNVFATMLLVRPSETLETRYAYTLPPSIWVARGPQPEYALLIQKQAGTEATPVQVQVRLPEGWTLIRSEPAPASQTASTLEYALTLETDQVLRLTFSDSLDD